MSNSTASGNTTSHYLAATIRVQNDMAKKVIWENTLKKEIIYVCGVDVAYRNNIAYCSAVLMNKNSMEVKESVNITLSVKHPYVPSFFMLRESEAIINILKPLKNRFDLLLIDGHGVLHPRRCGLASYVGVIIDRPTIGVAKSILCGSVNADHFIDVDGVISGFKMIKEKKKPIFISVGHKINLINAIRIVKQLVKPKERIPEPLRLADIYSKALANSVP
ncbi:MAG: endonuclease V [Thermoproteota archaeon]|nr:endonuclease V [Thermoproteota archaeon]